MESTVLSLGKSVLSGALGYAKSAAAEEVALQLGIQRDQAFIRGELEMMQAFLMAAHDEGDDNRVVRTWVKQVRDVAYNVEDCLQDFAVRLEKLSWWRIPCTLLDRRRVAKEMKELRAQVEDVSQRNARYSLIKGSAASKPAAAAGGGTAITMSGIDQGRQQRDKAKRDVARLINKKDDNDDLRVVAIWGKSTGDHHPIGETSIITKAYEDLKKQNKFEYCAWIRVTHPFDPTEFLQSIIEQFHVNFLQKKAEERAKATLEGQVLGRMGMKKGDDLARAFEEFLNQKSYLIVLDDLSTIEEWDCIKIFLRNNKKGSRIIVSTKQVGVASLCVGSENAAPEHDQLSTDPTLYVFYNKGSQGGTDSTDSGSSSTPATTDRNRVTHTDSTVEESQLIGRGNEKNEIIKLIRGRDHGQLEVISVWGMGLLGKTTVVRDIYQSQEISGMFENCAFVTIMRPFNSDKLLESLAMQLGAKDVTDLTTYLEGKRYLIVLDDLSSKEEWDAIIQRLPRTAASCIIVTTRNESIAKHCSEGKNRRKLNILEQDDARILFVKKVFKKTIDLNEQFPELAEEAEQILKKCKGLPLAIVTIGSFLANQPKTAVEWRKLNKNISAELVMNPEFESIKAVLVKSYDGLPYDLKSCFLYLSIFPEDHKVSRRRLVHRWTAESYSREVRGKSAEEIADSYFMELVSRSMILPSKNSIYSRKGIDSCQVHDLIREIGSSKSMEENLVFRVGEGSGLNTHGTTRHLAISSNWEGDESEFKSIVDVCRIRSLTVFGKWRPFFISDKMRLLRVLDLEDTSGLHDHHLEDIGKLLHLKYLSLRGCDDIYHLPNSLGNLRQLQILDVRDTFIVKLPRSITKLGKLNYLRLGRKASITYDKLVEDHAPKLMRNNRLCLWPVMLCAAWCACAPERFSPPDGMSHRDMCTACCCAVLPILAMRPDMCGVVVPRGVRKLKALHTLGVVDIQHQAGRIILQDIKRLTQLRKLGVAGINKRNGAEFCSAISSLTRLESLLVRSESAAAGLSGCLDGLTSPPKNLQSLKLYGNLVKLPKWTKELKSLVKLKLRNSRILESDAAMKVLGNLQNLAILSLLENSLEGEEEVHLNFGPEAFPSLVVLELVRVGKLRSVVFGERTTPKLELLRLDGFHHISGLSSLPSLKEFALGWNTTWLQSKFGDSVLSYGYYQEFMMGLQDQLARNPNRPSISIDA